MSLETDLLLDRRRLKRRLLLWRVLAVAAIAGVALLALKRDPASPWAGSAHIARLTVSGVIASDPARIRQLVAAGKDPQVKALIVAIDSPGGGVTAGEALHDAIAGVARHKPVVAVMGGLAASAGYMIAVPAERIFAHQSTLTGSIGVLLETGEVSGLLATLGITAEAIASGPLKDQPSFTRKLTDQGRAVLHGIVMDLYDQFVTMVAEGRHMDKARVRELADGRAYTGRQALALGLVDAIGDEVDARAWLASRHAIPADLPVEDLPREGAVQRLFGKDLRGLFAGLLKSVLSQGVTLDGAMALWQPGLTGE